MAMLEVAGEIAERVHGVKEVFLPTPLPVPERVINELDTPGGPSLAEIPLEDIEEVYQALDKRNIRSVKVQPKPFLQSLKELLAIPVGPLASDLRRFRDWLEAPAMLNRFPRD